MNKKLLATAVGVVLAGSMAATQADVTLYGNVNISIDAFDVDGYDDDVNMESNTSAIGVKGKEALGNGVSAIFKAEWQFEADGGDEGQVFGGNKDDSGHLFGRDQWVGLAGGFGKVRFGTISTSYKSHGAMIDPMYRTSLQGRQHGLQSNLHSGRGEEGEGRATNTVRYDSPDMNGLGLTVHYTFDSEDGPDGNDPFGIGAHYKWNGLYVFADYITSDQDSHDIVLPSGKNVDTGDDAWKVGGKYDFGNGINLYAQYEVDDGLLGRGASLPGGAIIDGGAATGIKRGTGVEGGDLWHLGGSMAIGNTLVYLGLAQRDDNDLNLGEYDAWTLAVDHRMSKRTDAYAGFNQVDCDDSHAPVCNTIIGDGEVDFFSVGLRHKF